VPREGELGRETWQWEKGEIYGGANPWGGFSLDEERGWVFCATGSAAGDFIYGGSRKGQNLFANCVLALDARTGQRQWHYQTVHHDIWDYDNPPAPVLATIHVDGTARDVAVQLTKMGLTFVLDRDTGQPVFPVEERPVPASNVVGEDAWPTQPFPVKPPPLVRLATYEADLSNISSEAHASALAQFRKHKTGFLYTPASLEGTITTPGHQGGAEWGGGAFDPQTGVLYVNVNEAPTINQLEPLGSIDFATATPEQRGSLLYRTACIFCHGPNRQGNPPLYPPLRSLALSNEEVSAVISQGRGIMPAFSQLSSSQLHDLLAYLRSEIEPASTGQVAEPGRAPRYAQIAPFFVDHEGYPAIAPPWGTLNAIDLNRGEITWKVPLGEYPELARRGIRNTGAKSFGGPVLTAGGLIFIAATPDEKIRAFDKYTGTVLWEHQLPAGGYATPCTYMVNGTQYVAIAAGGGGKLGTRYGDAIIAFALPAVN
jgi:quinoprotein glucose dehydrogenase